MAKADASPPACLGVLNILGSVLETNDTVYACVNVPLVFEDASLLDGLLTSRNWLFGDRAGEPNALLSAQATHAYLQEGTYTASLTVASLLCTEITVLKTVIVLGDPEFEVLVSELNCFGDCDGELTLNVQSVNAALYNVIWDITGQPGNALTDLCAGDYSAAIGDQHGCTATQTGAINIPEPDQLLAHISAGDTIGLCPTSGVTDIVMTFVGGTGDYHALWPLSSAISQVGAELMQFTPTATSLDQMYVVEVLDDNGCATEDSIFIRSLPSLLQGTVMVGGEPCQQCEVYQYKHAADPGGWPVMATTTTNSSGHYNFGIISNFIPFVIMADPNEDHHPMAAAGFYPEGHLWSTANEMLDVCGLMLDKHISLLEPMDFNGTNTFRGRVLYNPFGKTQAEEDPIPLIDVVVEKTPPGQAQGRVSTNINGEYEFDFVPDSDTLYTIYVSIPGVPVTSTYEILAQSGNGLYSNLDFCLNIDSTEFEICDGEMLVGSNNPVEMAERSIISYPNPNNGIFTIATGSFAETHSAIQIIDPMGRTVFQKEYTETPLTVNIVNLAEGYYLVRIHNGSRAESVPISVLRN